VCFLVLRPPDRSRLCLVAIDTRYNLNAHLKSLPMSCHRLSCDTQILVIQAEIGNSAGDPQLVEGYVPARASRIHLRQ